MGGLGRLGRRRRVFAGWALGMWFGVGIGSIIWLVSSLVMGVWTLWFGIALMRAPVAIGSDVGAD